MLTSSPAKLPYLGALDGLRCFAVLAVVFHHARFKLPASTLLFTNGGFLGVDIFFVISGFLITALLLVEDQRTDKISLRGFYWRRVVRLLPALIPVLATYLFYLAIVGDLGRTEFFSVAAGLGFVVNWWWLYLGNPGEGIVHLWSLAVEEQFYFVWPAVVMLVIRGRRFAVAAIFTGSVVIASMIWRVMLTSQAENLSLLYFRTDIRIDQLLIGALLAIFWFHNKVPQRTSVFGWLGVVVLAAIMFAPNLSSGFLFNGGFSIVALATAAVILACLGGDWWPEKILNLAPLRAIGKVSYGLYLWHLLIFWIMGQEATHLPAIVQALITITAVTFVVWFSWTKLEAPALKHKHRFGHTETGPPASPASPSSAVSAGRP